MTEDMTEQLSAIALANVGSIRANATAIEALLMVLGATKPEQVATMQSLLQQLGEQAWEDLEDESKPSYQASLNRFASVLEMSANR